MLTAFLAIPTVSPALGSMLLPHHPHKTLMDLGMGKKVGSLWNVSASSQPQKAGGGSRKVVPRGMAG